jgi:hypothetical protein
MDRPRGNKADRSPFEPGGVPDRSSTEGIKENAMLFPRTNMPRLSSNRFGLKALMVSATLTAGLFAVSSRAHGQIMVYEAPQPVTSYYTPMAAGYPGGYMANYSPAGNYAAVTAFSPPVATAYVANYPVTQVANYAVETVASPINVTSYYAPTPVGVTSYYAPAPVYAAPVTTYYAPAAVAVPVYRRGLFGGLRPTRSAMYIPY